MKAVATAQVATGNGVANGFGLGLLPWPKVDFSKFGEIAKKLNSKSYQQNFW